MGEEYVTTVATRGQAVLHFGRLRTARLGSRSVGGRGEGNIIGSTA